MRNAGSMRRNIAFALVMLVLARSASAQLNDLIKQNVQDARSSYKQLSGEQRIETPQLWIHVRSDAQKKLVAENLKWFGSIQLRGKGIDVRPLQLVAKGPEQSQLRFFKRQDREEAEQLLGELKKGFPGLQLQDLSGRYQAIEWLKPGHFELWLAPNVSKIGTP